MHDKCSVPGCTSNYRYTCIPDSPYVPELKLPTSLPQLMHIWPQSIHRDKISNVEKNVFVCVKHFRDEYIIRIFKTCGQTVPIALSLEININYQMMRSLAFFQIVLHTKLQPKQSLSFLS